MNIKDIRLQVLIAVIVISFMLPLALIIFGQAPAPITVKPVAPVLRLHILANSDAKEDQAVKLKIRDLILSKLGSLFDSNNSFEETIELTKKNLNAVERDIEGYLRQAGFNYGAKSSILVETFPETKYSKVKLPAGRYLALKIVLGEGEGHNWWCVLYPPLCYAELLEREVIEVMTGEKQGGESTIWQSIKNNYLRELKKILISQ